MPAFWRTHFALATAYGQLGEREAARNAVQDLLTIKPDFALAGRAELRKWWDAELSEHLIEGLRKAGLEIAGEQGTPPAKVSNRVTWRVVGYSHTNRLGKSSPSLDRGRG
jgi:hypothetical protein